MARRLPRISLVRAYEAGRQDCGYRVLVDRLWPRGVKKEDLPLDEWAKDLAPSPGLRRWFGHRPERWDEFRQRYTEELRSRPEAIGRLLKVAARRRVALLFGARDVEHSHAVVLWEFLQSERSGSARPTVSEAG
ncbi:DUF488 family protein [bacterium]|nr:DUF488 family protein [bacterium]